MCLFYCTFCNKSKYRRNIESSVLHQHSQSIKKCLFILKAGFSVEIKSNCYPVKVRKKLKFQIKMCILWYNHQGLPVSEKIHSQQEKSKMVVTFKDGVTKIFNFCLPQYQHYVLLMFFFLVWGVTYWIHLYFRARRLPQTRILNRKWIKKIFILLRLNLRKKNIYLKKKQVLYIC